MRIGAVQCRSSPGKIHLNLQRHLVLAEWALRFEYSLLCFPELSLSGYEPLLAERVALSQNDPILDPIQEFVDKHSVVLGVGLPLRLDSGIQITTHWFTPRHHPIVYAKQCLHEDEKPFFVPGSHQTLINVRNVQVAPAICYESLQPAHAEKCKALGGEVYLASVAKPDRSLPKASLHYSTIAKQLNMAVIMVNSLGPCDNFIAAGKSMVWNSRGQVVGMLDSSNEGILIYRTEQQSCFAVCASVPSDLSTS